MIKYPPYKDSSLNDANEADWDKAFRESNNGELYIPEPFTIGGVEVTGDRTAKKTKTDKVSSNGGSTSYYELPEGSKELWDLINHRNMNFAIGNIFKACYRLGMKEGNDDSYDLNKILFSIKQEIKRRGL